MPSSVDIRPGTLRDITYVAAHMRERDQQEILGVLPEDARPVQAGALCWQVSGPEWSWTAWHNGSPVCAFGLSPQSPLTPWLWCAWAFGTNQMRRAIPAVSRFAYLNWPVMLRSVGATRVEVRSLETHDIAHRWLASLGARREALCRSYGRNGENYELWAFLQEDFAHVHDE